MLAYPDARRSCRVSWRSSGCQRRRWIRHASQRHELNAQPPSPDHRVSLGQFPGTHVRSARGGIKAHASHRAGWPADRWAPTGQGDGSRGERSTVTWWLRIAPVWAQSSIRQCVCWAEAVRRGTGGSAGRSHSVMGHEGACPWRDRRRDSRSGPGPAHL